MQSVSVKINMLFPLVLLFVSLFIFNVQTQSSVNRCLQKMKRNNPRLEVRFSRKQLKEFCTRDIVWKQRSRARAHGIRPQLTRAQSKWLSNVFSCQDLSCVCQLDPSSVCDKIVSQVESVIENTRGAGTFPGIKSPFGRKKRQTRRHKVGKAVRKEYRMLTDSERERFHKALNKIKEDKIDGESKFDILIVYHTPEQSPGAHFGAALLPFHRELLKILELVLRSVDKDVAVPYWDSTLDDALPNSAHSILWTEDFLGNGDGEVVTGPFAHWQTLNDAVVGHLSNNRRIVRDVGSSEFGGLYHEDDLRQIRAVNQFKDLTFCVDPFFELVHGTMHMYVGGHMAQLRISTNDPVFWLLHSFVDYIWEDWRKLKQTRQQRETDYPSDNETCSEIYHGRDSLMKPFKIKNKDGLLNRYTNLFYEYEPRPTCTRSSSNCGSKYLFCDTRPRSPRCLAKVRAGGNCTGFENTDICYQGRCTGGVCKSTGSRIDKPPPIPVPSWEENVTTRRPTRRTRRTRRTTTTTTTTTTRRTPTTQRWTQATTRGSWFGRFRTRRPIPWLTKSPRRERVTPAPGKPVREQRNTVWLPITVLSLERTRVTPFKNGQIVAYHESQSQEKLRGKFGSANIKPYHTGAAYAQVLSPFANGGHTKANLHVFDEKNKPCVGMCLLSAEKKPWTYRPCHTEVVLDVDPRKSDNIPFTPYEEQMRHLNWQNNGKKIPDPFLFVCHAQAVVAPIRRPHGIRRGRSGDNTVVLKRDGVGEEFVDIKVKKPTKSVEEPSCMDTDRCCNLWASVGECVRNLWMRQQCQKSCFVCNGQKITGCVDYHPDCKSFASSNYCKTHPDWMEEHCRRSCGVCNRSRKELKKLCGGARIPGECKDYHSDCRQWSQTEECKRNPWWMAENCPKSCRAC